MRRKFRIEKLNAPKAKAGKLQSKAGGLLGKFLAKKPIKKKPGRPTLNLIKANFLPAPDKAAGNVAKGRTTKRKSSVVSAGGIVFGTAMGGPAKSAKLGPLLRSAMSRLRESHRPGGMMHLAMSVAVEGEATSALPIALSIAPMPPRRGERWVSYKQRIADRLGPLGEQLARSVGIKGVPMLAANSIQSNATPEQVADAARLGGLQLIELDPYLRVLSLDDAAKDMGLAGFRQQHPELTGKGVRVAVLDAGIDLKHPYLRVVDSVSTCIEPAEVHSLHGTHVAGCIASRDTVFGGIAPDVELINIKVLDSTGRGQVTFVSGGIDAALDRDVDVISISLGFNHLPTWSQGGHGWACRDGRCQLCTAVNNAVLLENASVVVSAGNNHTDAEFLRNNGHERDFDTELSCPGQCSGAITVGAVTKQTFVTADFSSRGPTAYGQSKPDIAADGVNITSTAPVPRGADGAILTASMARGQLTTRLSGTSMAAPLVSGVVALLVQQRKAAGQPRDAAAIRNLLLTQYVQPLKASASEVGVGRLAL